MREVVFSVSLPAWQTVSKNVRSLVKLPALSSTRRTVTQLSVVPICKN